MEYQYKSFFDILDEKLKYFKNGSRTEKLYFLRESNKAFNELTNDQDSDEPILIPDNTWIEINNKIQDGTLFSVFNDYVRLLKQKPNVVEDYMKKAKDIIEYNKELNVFFDLYNKNKIPDIPFDNNDNDDDSDNDNNNNNDNNIYGGDNNNDEDIEEAPIINSSVKPMKKKKGKNLMKGLNANPIPGKKINKESTFLDDTEQTIYNRGSGKRIITNTKIVKPKNIL